MRFPLTSSIAIILHHTPVLEKHGVKTYAFWFVCFYSRTDSERENSMP